ncbi:HAD-like domain [Lasallia pustulata]|nr:HAD-like domain [Lasallia pustulata]
MPPSPIPTRKSLCLTFDAFGTLFHPRQPIATQYAAAAREHGLSGFTDVEIGRRFKDAYKAESTKHPNYGRAVGMGAEQWWANIIRATLTPFVPAPKSFPESMVPQLLHRFSSSEGYTLYPDVLPFFQHLRRKKQEDPVTGFGTTVGVITNSDDRVSSILISLGLSVRPFKLAGMQWDTARIDASQRDAEDIKFVALSYDIGFEKPDPRIFQAVRNLMKQVKDEDFEYLHVGDDPEKDVSGAKAAGWGSLLLDREGKYVDVSARRVRHLEELKKVLEL